MILLISLFLFIYFIFTKDTNVLIASGLFAIASSLVYFANRRSEEQKQ